MFEALAELITWLMGDVASLSRRPGRGFVSRAWPAIVLAALSGLVLLLLLVAHFTDVNTEEALFGHLVRSPVFWSAGLAHVLSIGLCLDEYRKGQKRQDETGPFA